MKTGKMMLALLLAMLMTAGLFGCAGRKETAAVPETGAAAEENKEQKTETVPETQKPASEEPEDEQPTEMPELPVDINNEKAEEKEPVGEHVTVDILQGLIPSEMRVCRIDGYLEGFLYPKVLVIHSVEELEEHFLNYGSVFGFADGNGAAYAAEWRARYTEEYFAEKKLVVLLLEQGSGSVAVCPDGIYGNEAAAELRVTLRIPPMGTDDMAEYHVLFEVAKDVTEDLKPVIELEYPLQEFRYKWNDYGFLIRYPQTMDAIRVYYREDSSAYAWDEKNGEWGGVRLYADIQDWEKGYAELGFFPDGAPVPGGSCKVSAMTTEDGMEVTVYTPKETGTWGVLIFKDGSFHYAAYNYGLQGKAAEAVLSALLTFRLQ